MEIFKREDFINSLTDEEKAIVRKVDELYNEWIDLQVAKARLKEWEAKGKPKGYTIEEARKAVLGV